MLTTDRCREGDKIMDDDTTLREIVSVYNRVRENIAATREIKYRRLKAIIAAAAAAVIAIVIFTIYMEQGRAAFAIAIVGGFSVVALFGWLQGRAEVPAEKLQAIVRESLLPTIFSDIEGFRYLPNRNRLIESVPTDIKPDYMSINPGDLVEGSYKDRKFAINEVDLVEQKPDGNGRETVFKGVALLRELPAPLPATLTVRENRLALTKWASKKFRMAPKGDHVKFEHKQFETRYDVHSTDVEFARKVFDEKGILAYLTMQRAHATGNFQMSTSGSKVYLMIEHSHNFFEIPPIDRPFSESRDVSPLRTEIEKFLALMDNLDTLLVRN